MEKNILGSTCSVDWISIIECKSLLRIPPSKFQSCFLIIYNEKIFVTVWRLIVSSTEAFQFASVAQQLRCQPLFVTRCENLEKYKMPYENNPYDERLEI